MFQKAGRPGWKAVIPIYNLYIMLKIGDQGWWWLALLVVPLVQLYAIYRIHVGVARAFGKGILWGLALAFGGVLFSRYSASRAINTTSLSDPDRIRSPTNRVSVRTLGSVGFLQD